MRTNGSIDTLGVSPPAPSHAQVRQAIKAHGAQPQRWWEHAVIYQVAMPSFQDSNGDGKGDLRGLIERIDYLAWLGIGAVWLTPIHPSPMRDFGYDISDFCDIHPAFGTLNDFDELVAALHTRDIRLVLDYVPNHTSDEHPWFTESRG